MITARVFYLIQRTASVVDTVIIAFRRISHIESGLRPQLVVTL